MDIARLCTRLYFGTTVIKRNYAFSRIDSLMDFPFHSLHLSTIILPLPCGVLQREEVT